MRAGETVFRSCSNCRPTAWPASGLITPTGRVGSSSRVTSKRRSTPQAPSATTACSINHEDTSRRIHLPTAAPRKGYTGSRRESRPGIPKNATPSPPNGFNKGARLVGWVLCRSRLMTASSKPAARERTPTLIEGLESLLIETLRIGLSQLPRVATMTAFMVWILFSASSKTIEAPDSKTSSVTSMALSPNFW